MTRLILFTIFIFFSSSLRPQEPWSHGRIKVTADGHYLEYADGTPFFWLGDTGWELFHK